MKHLTVEDVAKQIGLTPKAIRQRIARGQFPFHKVALAKALGTTVDYLVGMYEEEDSDPEPAGVALVGA